jgi:2-polyprenyl-3-methyl-5-hydroxy-6-metoxy-1,4-benzoquinol methylase
MASTIRRGKSGGYEAVAERFMSTRNPHIGAETVREWSRALEPGSAILDLGCGHGVPISQVLIEEGFTVYGVDASPKLIAALSVRFPNVRAELSAVEDSEFFHRSFSGVVAWGLLFLLPADLQISVIRRIAKSLNPGGKFLFTAPKQATTWNDALTGHKSVSLGTERYRKVLRAQGLILDGERLDEGNNHYYLSSRL